jgi:mRNA interferase RelE/StbE
VAYRIIISRAAQKALSRLPQSDRERLARAIDALADTPRPPQAKALQGSEALLRVRVGDYRVIYRVIDGAEEVRVIRIGHRGEVYRRGLR